MDGYTQIEGRFGELEAQLYRQQVLQATDGARFVEVGSWKGRSAYCMAELIRASGKRIDFWCIDTWCSSRAHRPPEETAADSLFDAFLRNTQPVRDSIRPLRASSLAAADLFAEGSLDFVFLNVTCDFSSALSEIRAWLTRLKSSGVLTGHSYRSPWLGVQQAVETALGSQARFFGSCWYYSPADELLPARQCA